MATVKDIKYYIRYAARQFSVVAPPSSRRALMSNLDEPEMLDSVLLQLPDAGLLTNISPGTISGYKRFKERLLSGEVNEGYINSVSETLARMKYPTLTAKPAKPMAKAMNKRVESTLYGVLSGRHAVRAFLSNAIIDMESSCTISEYHTETVATLERMIHNTMTDMYNASWLPSKWEFNPSDKFNRYFRRMMHVLARTYHLESLSPTHYFQFSMPFSHTLGKPMLTRLNRECGIFRN